MTINLKALAEGQLAASVTAMYTTPASTQAVIKKITLVNTAAAARDVNLYINSGGTNRRIIPKDLTLEASESLETGDFALEAADVLLGDSTVDGTSIDYTVNGVEEVA